MAWPGGYYVVGPDGRVFSFSSNYSAHHEDDVLAVLVSRYRHGGDLNEERVTSEVFARTQRRKRVE